MSKRTVPQIVATLIACCSIQACHDSTSTRNSPADAADSGASKADGTDLPSGKADATPDSPGNRSDAEWADGSGDAAPDAAVLPDGSRAVPTDAPGDAWGVADVSIGTAETAGDVLARADVVPSEAGRPADLRSNDSLPDSPMLADAGSRDGSLQEVSWPRLDASGDVASDAPQPFRLAVAPNRMLDLVFMIDNSPSMAPKQAKLRAQFPKLIDALRDPSDGSMPDLRLAIIDSDLGTGGAYPSGSCGPNDSNGQSYYGDLGHFRMPGAVDCGVTDTNALWLEHTSSNVVNYTGDIGSVFSCLAGNLGTIGCGEEHSLQAFEFALYATNLQSAAQNTMLRPAAFLGLVVLTDEDDCSAATNDGLFGNLTELRGESASLRCATRAHACGGRNLTEVPGYPTTAAFSAPFSTCTARTDDCPNVVDGQSGTDTSVPTTCSPLRSLKAMADRIKALKPNPDYQIFMAGIFGWPLSDADMATATYRIDSTPNPNSADTAHPQVYDYWPVCYDPDHAPVRSDAGSDYDPEAWGWGAPGGVRISAFIDQFGENGMKYSICQRDYSAAMSKIGAALSKKMENLCVPERIGQNSKCKATFLFADANGKLVPDSTAMPACDAGPTNQPCFSATRDASLCPGSQYLIRVLPASTPPAGTMLEFVCDQG